MRLSLPLLILSITCTAQQRVLEFRGMRPGMNRVAFADAIANIAKEQGSHGNLDCLPTGTNTLCTWGLYDGLLSGDTLVSVTYRVPLFERPIHGFVKAFTQKYGTPVVERRSYENRIGASFKGDVFIWRRGTRRLEVAEMCSAVDQPCIEVSDPKLLKEGPAPPI